MKTDEEIIEEWAEIIYEDQPRNYPQRTPWESAPEPIKDRCRETARKLLKTRSGED